MYFLSHCGGFSSRGEDKAKNYSLSQKWERIRTVKQRGHDLSALSQGELANESAERIFFWGACDTFVLAQASPRPCAFMGTLSPGFRAVKEARLRVTFSLKNDKKFEQWNYRTTIFCPPAGGACKRECGVFFFWGCLRHPRACTSMPSPVCLYGHTLALLSALSLGELANGNAERFFLGCLQHPRA